MKSKKTAAAAISLAAVMMCGVFAGCDLITTDERKDLAQVIAEVNITNSASFEEEYGDYKDVISTAEITKLDMIASFISSGYSAMNSYGWSYKDTFDAICDSLVNRKVYLQYAMVYFLKNGWTDGDGNKTEYTLSAYKTAVNGEGLSDVEREIAGISYFLTEEESNRTDYTVRVMFNNTIDSQEKTEIEKILKEDDVEYETSVRTTPTGVNTTNDDYYDTAYRVFTGTETSYGSYERLEGSTATTRRNAYSEYLSNLSTNGLVTRGENTSDFESLNYFNIERKAAYEDALIQKLTDTFTAEAEASLSEEWCTDYFNKIVANQQTTFAKDSSSLESAMDSVSDTSFVLAASENDKNYGFVINILLPFSTAQSEALSGADQDFGDGKGNKFATRAQLLAKVKATDQRGSWFTGETDYSYDASQDTSAYTGGNGDRSWLFFEDSLQGEGTKYEPLAKYYGKYTYNGTYDAEKRVYDPVEIDIDGFVTEMEGYLKAVLGASALTEVTQTQNYYAPADGYYKADGTVDYSKFVYRSGKVNWTALDGGASFDANKMFLAGSNENKALSVINELSFAYNTDTAGLNSYLGYAVTANKTSFVSEFEYAAQWAVQQGAGSYVIAPSDYGWHIIYCTFSFADNAAPFAFDYSEKGTEGTFSYLFFEALKSNAATTYSSNKRSKIISAFVDGSSVYEKRYENLSNLGS